MCDHVYNSVNAFTKSHHRHLRTLVSVSNSGLTSGKMGSYEAEGRIVEAEADSHAALVASLALCPGLAVLHSHICHAVQVPTRNKYKETHSNKLQARYELHEHTSDEQKKWAVKRYYKFDSFVRGRPKKNTFVKMNVACLHERWACS